MTPNRAREPSAPASPLRARGLLLVAGVAAALLIAECGARLDLARRSLARAQGLSQLESPSRSRRGGTPLLDLLRPNPSPRLVFELKPDLETDFMGALVATDANGFRVAPRRTLPAERDLRIVGLGDSVMFGWGVPYADTYLARLEVALTERLRGRDAHAVNTAVPGYNTALEIETLLSKGLRHRPDLVILGWVNNDLDLPSFLRPYPSPWTPKRWFFREWAATRISQGRIDPFASPQISIIGGKARVKDPTYLARLSPNERSLVGVDAVDEALRRLAETAIEHAFRAVVFVHRGRVPYVLRTLCDKHGLPVVSAFKLRNRFLRSSGIERAAGSSLALSADDPHPSSIAHELAAQAILDHLEDEGALKAWNTRVRQRGS